MASSITRYALGPSVVLIAVVFHDDTSLRPEQVRHNLSTTRDAPQVARNFQAMIR
ncbi:hypothetical protein ACTQ5N_00530 [Atopobiaceae bacterium Sow4_H2]